MRVTGTIRCNGTNGGNGGNGGASSDGDYDCSTGDCGSCGICPQATYAAQGGAGGGGGGGSGGGIRLKAYGNVYITGSLQARGGNGGAAGIPDPSYGSCNDYAKGGAGGGGGRIKIIYSECAESYTISPSVNVSGGSGGSDYSTGGNSGSSGTYNTFVDNLGTPPSDPTPTWPPNNAKLNYNIVLQWSSTGGSYLLKVDDNPNFSSPVISTVTAATSYTISGGLTSGQTYYWYVRARSSCPSCPGGVCWGQSSQILSFTFDASASDTSWYQNCLGISGTTQLREGTVSGSATFQSETGVTDDGKVRIQP